MCWCLSWIHLIANAEHIKHVFKRQKWNMNFTRRQSSDTDYCDFNKIYCSYSDRWGTWSLQHVWNVVYTFCLPKCYVQVLWSALMYSICTARGKVSEMCSPSSWAFAWENVSSINAWYAWCQPRWDWQWQCRARWEQQSLTSTAGRYEDSNEHSNLSFFTTVTHRGEGRGAFH